MTARDKPVPSQRIRAAFLLSALLLPVLVATSGAVGPQEGTANVSNSAANRVAADLLSGAITPADFVFEIEGPLTAAIPDANPALSGIEGVLVVSGLGFRVPTGVPIRVTDAATDTITFSDILNTPPGHTNLVGNATVIATGTWHLAPTVGGTMVVYTADDVFLEKAENVLFGILTDSTSSELFINGVRVVREADPRFAPYTYAGDLSGQPLAFEEFEHGRLVVAEGYFNRSNNTLVARIIELDGIIPPEPGDADWVSVLRAEGRVARNELRVRGFTNNVTATLSIYAYDGGVKGALLFTSFPVDPADGLWDVRGVVPVPTRILVETSNGGSVAADVIQR